MRFNLSFPHWLPVFAAAISLCAATATVWAADSVHLLVTPNDVKLDGNFAQCQILVTKLDASGKVSERSEDLTSDAKYTSSDPAIVSVDENGLLLARGNGQAKITIAADKLTRELPVTVSNVVEHPRISFMEQIRPILNKSSCATAACHAAQHGKGGFKLSVFGSEPSADHTAMVRDSVLRRADFVQPENSLVVLKPTTQVPHGGGRRFEKGSVDYQVMIAWLESDAAAPGKADAEVTKLTVTPTRRLDQVGAKQQLRVEAEYSNGKRRDVTASAIYDSMDDGVVTVTRDGLVTTVGKGQAPIMVRLEGQAEISLFVVPYSDKVELAGWKNNNFVDEQAVTKFRELGIEPSPLCDDATFVRRAFLDTIGTLPTADETQAFLQSADAQKREKLIDRLLGLTGDPSQDIYNDWYAAYWSLKWSDLLRNNSTALGDQGMWALHNWIKDSFQQNKRFDQFVKELITAKGSIYRNGPANYFRINLNPPELAEATSQLFMGVRLECAKCHHHPFEKYSQDDYYNMAAFFARIGSKGSDEFGLFGRETAIVVKDSGEISNPRTRKQMEPKPLDGPAADHPLDRRIALAQWLTGKDNMMFAKSVVNRYVHYLLGRGLVEPVDDMRSTNPPTNPPLMDALAKHFVENDFSLKQLMRAIMTSRLYQLDSQPTAANIGDSRFYSHFPVKRLTAEPLADAIDRVTATQTKYKNLPLGTRAIELPDAIYPDYFLNTFAKPRRASVCECERTPDANLAQALHTLNGDTLANKIGDKNGRIAKLLAAKKPHEEIVKELYLTALSRFPTDQEIVATQQLLSESPTPEECYQDLQWALINSKQFLFIH